MDTDQLIRTLAADNAYRARPVGFVLALLLLAAAPVSLLMFFAELGVRPDVMTAVHNPFFDLKFAVTLALAAAAITVALHLSRPEASLRSFVWLFMVPAGLLIAGISSEMMVPIGKLGVAGVSPTVAPRLKLFRPDDALELLAGDADVGRLRAVVARLHAASSPHRPSWHHPELAA